MTRTAKPKAARRAGWTKLSPFEYGMLVYEIRKIFIYDKDSPSCVSYKPDIFPKKAAGTRRKRGQGWMISIKGKQYPASFVVWHIFNPEPIPKGCWIDHKNGLRNDNLISNLRIARFFENSQNRNVSRNKTGEQNIYFEKRWKKNFVVEFKPSRTNDGPKTYVKRSFVLLEDAIEFRNKESVRRFGQFSPFYGVTNGKS